MKPYDVYRNGRIVKRDDILTAQNLRDWNNNRGISDEKIRFVNQHFFYEDSLGQIEKLRHDIVRFRDVENMRFLSRVYRGQNRISDLLTHRLRDMMPRAIYADTARGLELKSSAIYVDSLSNGIMKLIIAYFLTPMPDSIINSRYPPVILHAYAIPLRFEMESEVTDQWLNLEFNIKAFRSESFGEPTFGYVDGNSLIKQHTENLTMRDGPFLVGLPTLVIDPLIGNGRTEDANSKGTGIRVIDMLSGQDMHRTLPCPSVEYRINKNPDQNFVNILNKHYRGYMF